MSLVVYNTLTRATESFETIEPGKVRMYVCGPTVYAEAHVGHAMSSIVFDFIRRYLQYKGYDVRHVMNFTDVDDKIIARAAQSGDDPAAIAERHMAHYQEQLRALNVLPPSVLPRVSQTIPEIIAFIQGLVDKGYAYEAGGDVYFRVRADEDYGKLSRRKLEAALSGTRVAASEAKVEEGDFALWKAAKPGEPSWDSPWGKGRPGWHIECSAMSMTHLGEQIDIHGGGNDLIFPHHENEIAQSESYTDKPFARYWMHNGFLNIDDRKMSKSLGNFFTVRQISDEIGYEPIRYFMLSAHYRTPLNFTMDILEQCKTSLERLYTCRDNLAFAIKNADATAGGEQLREAADTARARFCERMDDDLNTADALAVLFDFAREINTLSAESSAGALQHAADRCVGAAPGGAAGRWTIDRAVRRSVAERSSGSARGQAVGAERQDPRWLEGARRHRRGFRPGQHLAVRLIAVTVKKASTGRKPRTRPGGNAPETRESDAGRRKEGTLPEKSTPRALDAPPGAAPVRAAPGQTRAARRRQRPPRGWPWDTMRSCFTAVMP